MKGFRIDVARCNDCSNAFLYIPGKINSIANRNSDIHGCPRCPVCGKYTATRNVGKLKILTYAIVPNP